MSNAIRYTLCKPQRISLANNHEDTHVRDHYWPEGKNRSRYALA